MTLVLLPNVKDSLGRSVRHQNVDFFEVAPQRGCKVSLVPERGLSVFNRMRRAEDLQALDFDILMLQVGTVLFQNRFELGWRFLC